MTKKELRKKFRECERNASRIIRAYFECALKSDAVDGIEDEPEGSYRIAKNILCAALKEARFQYRPFIKSDESAIANIHARTMYTQPPSR